MVVLLTAGLSALHIALPISIAVALLMAIVIASYRQTVRAYETSGGAYVVARENLGTLPSLVAAAALLVDYVLTVAVSVASGVLAITSAAPSLNHYNTELSLARDRADHRRQPARRPRVRVHLCAADVRLHRRDADRRRRRRDEVRGEHVPARGHAARDPAGRRRGDALPRAEGVRIRRERPDRRRVDRERRQRVPPSAVEERGEDTRRARRRRDHDLRRRLVPRGRHARASELDRLGRLADRPRRLPAGQQPSAGSTGSSRSSRSPC